MADQSPELKAGVVRAPHHFADTVLHPVKLAELRPTQMTLGMREVAGKRRRFRDLERDERTSFLARHMVPTVLGPKGRRYLIDHHHLCRALLEEGCDGVFAMTVADFSPVDSALFWTVMDHHGWVHSYDKHGRRMTFDELPKTLDAMDDDPFRSLAGELRRAGGFAKDVTPFNEFLWASHFREIFKPKRLAGDFDACLQEALQLARSEHARYLPGWCGPH